MNPTLLKLQSLLGRRSVDAKTIARELSCSIPTAYRRIRSLVDAGAVITETQVPRRHTTGPAAKMFKLHQKA